MNHSSIRKNVILLVLAVALCSLTLVSCVRDAVPVSDRAGVGRESETPAPAQPTEIVTPIMPQDPGEYTPPPLDPLQGETAETPSDETPPAGETPAPVETPQNQETTGPSVRPATNGLYEFKDGKYVYYLPNRDTSGLATIAEMDSTPNVPFEDGGPDQPNDWYPGKTDRDPYTGEVTVKWDRYASTLEAVRKYHGIYRGDESKKVCYLTFDCGYEYGPTPKILDVLKEKQAPGLFFVTGQYVSESTDLVKRMLDEGHLVGNHTKSHYRMTTLTAAEAIDELDQLENLYKSLIPGAPDMLYFRPPYGNVNEWLLKLMDKAGYITTLWSWTYMDYDTNNQWAIEDALSAAQRGLHNGCVYLFHTESWTNANMLGDLIDWIRAQGYEIVPMCDYNA